MARHIKCFSTCFNTLLLIHHNSSVSTWYVIYLSTLGHMLCKTAFLQLEYKHIIISIQPKGRFWQEPEPSQATGMALAQCFLGSFLGVVCHYFPPPLDVPIFASRCLHVQAT